jgi:hypothetical protein
MKTIKVENYGEIPRGFTGIAEWADGRKEWILNGKLHREDGPAWEGVNGTKEWYINGKLHREDGPACEGADGAKQWWLNGKRHRVDGPAIECADGRKEWFLNGKRHREDGPAWEWADGKKEWYADGWCVHTLRKPIGDYIVVEDGLPSTMEWLGEPVSTLKVLTAEGIQFIPNLPGI